MRRTPWLVILLLLALGAYLAPERASSPFTTNIRLTPNPQVVGAEELPTDTRALFQKSRPATVRVTTLTDAGAIGIGTGFFVNDAGLLLTAYHVVDGGRLFTVTTFSGQKFSADLIGFDNAADVALLKIRTRGKVPYLNVTTRAPRVGEQVLAIGNSREQFLQPRRGRLLSLNADAGEADFPDGTLEMSAPLAPGDSGGPIIDGNGEAIGVVSYIRVNSQDETLASYAVPVTQNGALYRSLRSGEKKDVPAIGIAFDRTHDGVTDPPGAVISLVPRGGPAARAGLRAPKLDADGNVVRFGDIITAVDGTRTRSANDVIFEIRRRHIGETVTLTVQRGDQSLRVPLKLVAKGSIAYEE
ncbi:S1C family serine protease [Deinococcus maricopensis]|uniref:Peptidase S1 and S6 chymotrypsin/Hap n=1 Tax=Deinococcus maricopensis (strain DSM 21211 / LMG 22137 / NRRL B-23946 / LB-34) TaxID=709986 RepID=E8UC31_DEIML|nr:S1C family serine protease [Deinococcus maricopensis]ADV68692.1 peptidase S1 and S6 chymotrypsin/Hap [Deinococcus maricopensis DSM 21211]